MLGLIAVPTQAATIVSFVNDNFDGYADQAAYQVAWTTVTTATQLSTAQAVSAPNSVLVNGTSSNSMRSRATFSETGTPGIYNTLTWSFDYYDSAASAATSALPQRNYANLQDTTAPSGTNQLISMGLNNNQTNTNSGGAYYMARILGFSPPTIDPDGGPNEGGTLGSGAYFKLNDFGSPHRTQGWHNLTVVISTDDGLSTDYAFYVDNLLAERVSNVGTAASLRSYDNITMGSGLSNGSTSVNFDNMVLSAIVPEPTTLAMSVLGGLALLRRRT